MKTGTTAPFNQSKVKFDSKNYVSKQVFYTSKDGTKISMIISHKKGVELDGNNPTILYGYGGFNISLTPSFNITRAIWMEQGTPASKTISQYADIFAFTLYNMGFKTLNN